MYRGMSEFSSNGRQNHTGRVGVCDAEPQRLLSQYNRERVSPGLGTTVPDSTIYEMEQRGEFFRHFTLSRDASSGSWVRLKPGWPLVEPPRHSARATP